MFVLRWNDAYCGERLDFVCLVLFVSCMMWLWSLSPWKIDMFCVMLSSVALSQLLLSMSFLCQVRHCSACALIPHAMSASLEVRCREAVKTVFKSLISEPRLDVFCVGPFCGVELGVSCCSRRCTLVCQFSALLLITCGDIFPARVC